METITAPTEKKQKRTPFKPVKSVSEITEKLKENPPIYKHGISFMQFISSLQGVEVFSKKGSRLFAYQLFHSNHSLHTIFHTDKFHVEYLSVDKITEKRKPIVERKN